MPRILRDKNMNEVDVLKMNETGSGADDSFLQPASIC